jgi:hypothetical protein
MDDIETWSILGIATQLRFGDQSFLGVYFQQCIQIFKGPTLFGVVITLWSC